MPKVWVKVVDNVRHTCGQIHRLIHRHVLGVAVVWENPSVFRVFYQTIKQYCSQLGCHSNPVEQKFSSVSTGFINPTTNLYKGVVI